MVKILVVDDEKDVRTLVRSVLEKGGYEISEAESGSKAVESLRNGSFDLVLLDVMMPEVDGWKVAKMIKEDPRLKDTVVCMLTVKSSTLDALMSLDYAKADWHLNKPITKERLIQTVDWLLQQRKKKGLL